MDEITNTEISTAMVLEMTEKQEKAYDEFIDFMVELYRKYGDEAEVNAKNEGSVL